VYVITGLVGWYWWIERRENTLKITQTPRWLLYGCWAGIAILSYPVSKGLIAIGGAATYWDGITTLLSLAGQYLLMKKYIGNWWFWITADVIYIGLFLTQHLFLSAQLYAIFLIMCIAGVLEWRKTLKTNA
jgi:nicotinamide mononucleotide transporter